MATTRHESSEHTITLDQFREAFHDDSIQKKKIADLAERVQYRLGRIFQAGKLTPEARSIEGLDFSAIYDPSLPTIAVDLDHTYSGSELLGLVSHEEGTRANIVYISTPTGTADIQRNRDTGEGHLEIKSGAVVLPNGQVAYGEFPYPIAADILDTADLALVEQAEANNVSVFHPSSAMRRFDDKGNVESLSSNEFTYTPKRITGSELLERDNVDDLVIKPSKHSQGRGVLLTDRDADVEHTKRFYQYLEDNNYEPVIEERARSYEITDPRSGERLDWNVRAILSYGELVDMYVRADKWGGPVNMSISARAISMDDFPKYFKNPNDAWKVMQALHDSAQAVAMDNPSSLIGIDLTVDEDMRSCLFEINNGNTGGLQTIAKLEKTYDDKLFMSRQILRKYIDNTKQNDTWQDEAENESIPLMPSLDTLAWTAYDSKLKSQMEKLDINEIPENDEERYGAVLALVAIRSSFYWKLTDYRVAREAGERLKNQYPLELRKYLLDIYLKDDADAFENYESYFSEHSELFRDDLGTIGFHAALVASKFDLVTYKQLYQQYAERFAQYGRNFHDIANFEFRRVFRAVFDEGDEENESQFHNYLEDVITAFSEYGYDAADKLLSRAIEKNDAERVLSRALHALRFCIAFGNENYDDAKRYFIAAEDEYPDENDFYENVSDSLIPRNMSDFAASSPERVKFAVWANIRSCSPVPALTDALEYIRAYEVGDDLRSSVIEILADETPLDHTNDERERFIEVLRKAAATDTLLKRDFTPLPGMENMSDYAKYTLVIERLFAGDYRAARIIGDKLEDEHILYSFDYLQEVFEDN
jgi:hypothetical protein